MKMLPLRLSLAVFDCISCRATLAGALASQPYCSDCEADAIGGYAKVFDRPPRGATIPVYLRIVRIQGARIMAKWVVIGIVAVVAAIGIGFIGFVVVTKDMPTEAHVAPESKPISESTNVASQPKPISESANDELRKTVVLNCEDMGPGTAKILCEMERMR